jgi:hypothetical protein
LQCHVEEHPRIAILELEFDFADRLDGFAVGSADLALVNGRLDPSGWTRADCDNRSRAVVVKTGRNSSPRTVSGSHLPVFGASRTGRLLGIWSSHSFLSNTSA